MSRYSYAGSLLDARFANEWQELPNAEAAVVLVDFCSLLDEYDVPEDDAEGDLTGLHNAIVASFEYRNRIGRGNLAAYAATLLAGERRTLRMSGRMHQPDESDE